MADPYPIQALIFDCDGTLANTMPLHWEAWQVVTRRYNLHFPEERFYALGGVPSHDILKLLGEEQGVPLDALQAAREKEEAYVPFIPQVRPVQAVVDIVHQHHGRLPMAVATGGIRSIIHPVLKHLGILHLFNTVVTSEDVDRQKPAPDIFLEAARRLAVPPEHCRAYEDTDLGMQAIRAAGMDAVDVRPMIL